MKRFFDDRGEELNSIPALSKAAFFLSVRMEDGELLHWKHHRFRLRFSLWQRKWEMPLAFSGSTFPQELLQHYPGTGVCKIWVDRVADTTRYWLELAPVLPPAQHLEPGQPGRLEWEKYWDYPGSKQAERHVYEPGEGILQLLFSPDGELMESSISFVLVQKGNTYIIPLCASPRVHSVGLMAFLETEWALSSWNWDVVTETNLKAMDTCILLNAVRGVFRVESRPTGN